MSKERYVNLSNRQVKDTQNQSQYFMSINTICQRLNTQDKIIANLEAKLAEKDAERELDNSFWKQECDSLQKTLAEKENTITTLIEDSKTSKEFLKQQLAEKETRIAELEEQLKNAIVPKYKIEQEVFVIYEGIVKKTTINSITIFEGNEFSYYCKHIDGERFYLELEEQDLFATKEEVEAKLQELTVKNV